MDIGSAITLIGASLVLLVIVLVVLGWRALRVEYFPRRNPRGVTPGRLAGWGLCVLGAWMLLAGIAPFSLLVPPVGWVLVPVAVALLAAAVTKVVQIGVRSAKD